MREYEQHYRDVATLTKGIFFYINREFPGITIEQMDIAFFGKFSMRWISPMFECCFVDNTPEDAMTQIAGVVKGLLGDKWDKIEAALAKDYDILDTYHVTYDQEGTYDSTFVSSQLDKNDIYGFDTSDGSPVGDNQKDSNVQRTDHHDTKDHTERRGRQGGMSPQELIRQEIELRSHNYIEEVLHDVAKILTLDVY